MEQYLDLICLLFDTKRTAFLRFFGISMFVILNNSKDVSLRAKFKKFDLKTKREMSGNYHIDILAYNDDQNIRQKAHELIDRLREEVSKNSINEFEIREINAAIKDFEKE